MAVVQIADVIVPEIFSPYVQQLTEEKSLIISSGVVVRDGAIDALLAGGGLTFNTPSWNDLRNDEENVSDDDPTNQSTPKKNGTSKEVSVRLNRNQSWSTMDLVSALAGTDPAGAIAQRVGYYWTRRMQAAFVAVMKGVFADNDAAPTGTEHVLGDLSHTVASTTYTAGVTDFSAAAFLDTTITMGDSEEALGMILMHSITYNRARKNNLIDFIPDSEGKVNIPTYLGKRVVIDDGMPNAAGVFETWIFGPGAVRLGVGTPKVPTETKRDPNAGNGSGQDTLYNRVEWCFHPVGHKFAASTPPAGGPTNSATTGNLGHQDSWQRVFPERKQIKIARLITREF